MQHLPPHLSLSDKFILLPRLQSRPEQECVDYFRLQT